MIYGIVAHSPYEYMRSKFGTQSSSTIAKRTYIEEEVLRVSAQIRATRQEVERFSETRAARNRFRPAR